MNEDPIFYKSLSALIREAINDYHQHRIDEALYLPARIRKSILTGKNKIMFQMLSKTNQMHCILQSYKCGFRKIAFSNTPRTKRSGQYSIRSRRLYQNIAYENGTLIIDWQPIRRLKRIKKLDDLLFEKQQQYDTQFHLIKLMN
jgi:type I restriction enzyme R subunit